MRREKRRRIKLSKKLFSKRTELKAILKSDGASIEDKLAASRKSCKNYLAILVCARVTNRCAITGRPKGYYRKFGLGRIKVREAAMRGDIPGLVRAELVEEINYEYE